MCTRGNGSVVCECRMGYELANDGLSCRDINECINSNGGCDHRCHNTEGHFYCSCKYGYTLDNNGNNCTYQSMSSSLPSHVTHSGPSYPSMPLQFYPRYPTYYYQHYMNYQTRSNTGTENNNN